MYIYHIISIHISSVALYDQTEDMHTLQPLQYQMICHKYDIHVASLYLYILFLCNFFHQTFCFENFGFDLRVFKYLSRQDSNDVCIVLSEIQHSHPHMTLYRAEISFNCGGNNVCNVETLIMILFYSSLASFRPPSFGSLTRIL